MQFSGLKVALSFDFLEDTKSQTKENVGSIFNFMNESRLAQKISLFVCKWKFHVIHEKNHEKKKNLQLRQFHLS